MSYDISICVKVEGCGKYVEIAEPKYRSPTYNLGKMFRECMDWDYHQSVKDENGEYRTVYYPCDEIIGKIERGIVELLGNRQKYKLLEPENGWGTVEGAIKTLLSLKACIYECAEDIPLSCLYMRW